ncbi:MAG TPA: DUF2933 domain-containing protein [Caulobacterales bacterium]|nr:DUF2933 domain-containing protein [Caulobacterales bacterium]
MSWVVRILMIALIAVIGYYLITEHTAHVLAGLPLLFLLACPLMHLFMHGGHGGHGGHSGHAGPDTTQPNQTNERSGQ